MILKRYNLAKAAVFFAIFLCSALHAAHAQNWDYPLDPKHKIVVFRFESDSGPLSLEATERVISYIKRKKELDVMGWIEDRNSSSDFIRTTPEERKEICREHSAGKMLIGEVGDDIKYGQCTFKGCRREALLNISLHLKLIESETGKILWEDVQNSRDFISDQTLSPDNFSAHISLVSKSMVDDLMKRLGFSPVREGKIELISFSKGIPSVKIDGRRYVLNDSVFGGEIINITNRDITLRFSSPDREETFRLGQFIR